MMHIYFFHFATIPFYWYETIRRRIHQIAGWRIERERGGKMYGVDNRRWLSAMWQSVHAARIMFGWEAVRIYKCQVPCNEKGGQGCACYTRYRVEEESEKEDMFSVKRARWMCTIKLTNVLEFISARSILSAN